MSAASVSTPSLSSSRIEMAARIASAAAVLLDAIKQMQAAEGLRRILSNTICMSYEQRVQHASDQKKLMLKAATNFPESAPKYNRSADLWQADIDKLTQSIEELSHPFVGCEEGKHYLGRLSDEAASYLAVISEINAHDPEFLRHLSSFADLGTLFLTTPTARDPVAFAASLSTFRRSVVKVKTLADLHVQLESNKVAVAVAAKDSSPNSV